MDTPPPPNETRVESPAEGHYVIHYNARPVLTSAGHLVPPRQVHITPDLPSEVLLRILRERGDLPEAPPKKAPPKKAPAKKAATKKGGEE